MKSEMTTRSLIKEMDDYLQAYSCDVYGLTALAKGVGDAAEVRDKHPTAYLRAILYVAEGKKMYAICEIKRATNWGIVKARWAVEWIEHYVAVAKEGMKKP